MLHDRPVRSPLPILKRPEPLPVSVNPPNQKPQNVVRAVLYQVSPSDNNPTTCSVLLQDHWPPRPGYSMPAGCGQFYKAGSTITNQQGQQVAAPGPFYCDPTTRKGGTFVLVDTVNKTVVQVLQGSAQSMPSSAANLVATHHHNGGTDVYGNPMPEQINLASEVQGILPLQNHAANPSPDTAPVCTDNPLNTPTYPIVGSGSYDAEIAFDLTMPSNYASWMCEVRVYAVLAGTTVPAGHNPFATVNAAMKTTMAPTSGAYKAIAHGLVSGQAYDLYVVFVDGQGVISAARKIASTVANPMNVGYGTQMAYPGGASALEAVTPSVTLQQNNGVSAHNAATFDAEVTFSLDAKGYSGSGNQWLAEIQLWAAVNPAASGITGTAQPFQAGTLAPQSSGNYTGVWPSLGNGLVYDLYVRYVDYEGNYSALSASITQASAGGIGSGALQKNPNPNQAPQFSTNPHNIGGSYTDAVFTYTGAGSGSYDAATNFTLTVSNPTWLKEVQLYVVPSGSHVNPLSVSNNQPTVAGSFKGTMTPSSNGTYTATFHGLSAGTGYDCYIAYVDLQGTVTPYAFAGTSSTNNLQVGPGQITSFGGPNLVVDSDFIHVSSGSPGSDTGSNDPYWQFYWIDGSSFYIGAGQNAQNYLGIRPADSSRDCMAQSEVIPVTPGTTYTVSGYIDASTCSGNKPAIEIVSTDGTTIYHTVSQNTGQSGRVSDQWSCQTGVTQVCVRFRSYKTTVGSSILVFATPMFQQGLLGPYLSGPSVPNAVPTTPPSNTSPAGDGGTGSGGGPASTTEPGTIKHPVLPSPVRGRIANDGTLDVSSAKGSVSGNLPLANHDTTVQTGASRANTAIDSSNVVVASGVDMSRSYTNKTLDYMGDGSTYARIKASSLTSNDFDFSKGGVNKTVDNIGDGTTYARVKSTELASGTVKQLNDGTNTRTVASIASNINADGTTQISKPNLLPNADFAITGGTFAWATTADTGSLPKFWCDYNNTNTAAEACTFAADTSAGAPVGTAWKLTYSTNTTTKGLRIGSNTGYSGFTLKAGVPYVFSFYAKGPANAGFHVAFDNSNISSTPLTNYPNSYNDTNWHRYAFVLTVTADYTANFYPYTGFNPGGVSTSVWFAGMQLEEGSTLSPWSGSVHTLGITDFLLPHPNKNLDNVGDGSSYARVTVNALTSNSIDFSKASGFFNKTQDYVGDGSTYARIKSASLTSNDFDFSKGGVNKTQDYIGDGSTYARIKATSLTSNDFDFAKGGVNKVLDNIGDGSTYARIKATSLTSNDFDFAKGGLNKVLDNIGDGSTYARVKGSELASGTVKQLNDGTNVRTAGAVAGAINNTADPYGSYFKYGSVHRGILEASGQPGAANLLYNPTFINGFVGWSRYQGNGGNVSWYTDGFGSGRAGMNGGTLPANGVDLYQQYLKLAFWGQSMVYSAIVEVDAALPSGSYVFIQIQESPGNQVYTAQVTGPDVSGNSRMTVILPFTTTSGNTTLIVKVGIQGNSSTATTVPNITFQKLQLEYGTQPTTYVDHTATSLVHTTIQKALGVDGSNPYMTKNQNLVFNGDFSLYTVPSGIQSQFASSVRPTDDPRGTPNGWSRNWENGGNGEGSIYRITNAVNGGCSTGDYALLLQDPNSSGNYDFGAVCDAFPVTAGKQYTFSADVYPGFASSFPSGACWYFRVLFYKAGTTDFSRNSASLSGSVPVLVSSVCLPSSGAPGTWSANGVVDIVSQSTLNGQMYHPTGTVVAPSDAAYCRIAFYHWGNTTAAWNLAISNVKCVEAWSSGQFNGQGSMCTVGGVPSSLPYSSTTTSVTLNLPAATLTYADQSVANVAASSPSFSGLSATHTYYVIVGINTATKGWTAYLSASQYSGTQIVQNIAGDGYIPVWQNATVTTPASGTGGGTGSGGGGLNGGGSCPATWQRVYTREIGWVRADEVEVGMHLPNKGGTWTRVLDAVKLPAPIWSYTLVSKDNVFESFDVNDTHAVQLTNGEWLMAKDMRGGEEVVGEPSPLTVVDAHYVKDAHYIAFTVEEPHEFMLGGALCHNATTL